MPRKRFNSHTKVNKNFRSFKDEAVPLDPYTCLVGPNGAGKSTILTALNVFFRNTSSSPANVLILSREDFHHGNTQDPVRITLTFTELSAEGQEELSHYYRQGRLVVSAVARWNEKTETADVKQYGIRTVMKPFAPYFALAERKAKATELQECYDQIREQFPDLPVATTGPKREVALREFEESRPELCEPHEAETQFYGFTRGSNLLDKYIQWVYVPAVKDASSEQDEGGKGALKTLLDRTVRGKVNFKEPIATLKKQVEDDYQKIIDSQKEVLESLQISMRARLREWASPDAELTLGWHRDDRSIVVNEPYARAAIGEDNFLGDVARLGHGMQRSFLVAILQELAPTDFEHSPTLLLGIEEPELYQHPPQAHHIAQVMENLATRAETNTQVLLSTHSPHFVPTKGFASVRLVRKHPVDKCSLVASTTYEKVESVLAKALGDPPDKPTVTMATIEQIMQPSQKELYFCKVAVLVEGPEDVGYIATHLLLTKKWDEFRKLGCHFIVTGGKTNMSFGYTTCAPTCTSRSSRTRLCGRTSPSSSAATSRPTATGGSPPSARRTPTGAGGCSTTTS